MPTCNRREFVPRAIGYFLRQDYPARELLILDDGSDPVEDLVPQDERIRYLRLPQRASVGAKRNLACQQARGELILHWDDDDWYAPERIRKQVAALLEQDGEICGLRQMLFFEPRTQRVWLYEYPVDQKRWLTGGSLLYWKRVWQRHSFSNMQIGEDTRFLWSMPLDRAVTMTDYRIYVALVHAGNTSPKETAGTYWHPWQGSLREIMGADLDTYRANGQKVEVTAPAAATVAMAAAAAVGPAVPASAAEAVEPDAAGAETPAAVESAAATERPVDEPTPEDAQIQVQTAARAAEYVRLPFFYVGNAAASTPRVSCILATGNRTWFTRQAIRYFLRQTLDDSELIVVDDGIEPVEDLCAGLLRVRYIRLDQPTLLGTKLNIGIRQARGQIIQKLDDDDYYAPDFLERAVKGFNGSAIPLSITAWDCFLVLLAGSPRLHFSGHGWQAGGSLCFPKKLWEQAPFRDLPKAVDEWFLRDHPVAVTRVCAPEMYLLVRHGKNTWTETSWTNVDAFFARCPVDPRGIERVVEPLDLPFYRALIAGGQAWQKVMEQP